MKNKFIAYLVFIALYGSHCAATHTPQKAENFINNLVQQVHSVIKSTQDGSTQQSKAFGKLLQENFNTQFLARSVLGPFYRTLTPDQQDKFHTLYKKRIIKEYGKPSQIERFKGYTHRINAARHDDKTRSYVVDTTFEKAGETDVQVVWYLRPDGVNFKIVNLSIEGVSKLQSDRSNFATLISQSQNNPKLFLERFEQSLK